MKYREFRDRPLTCRGGYGFLFRSDFFFRTTRELEYLFCLSRKAQFFLPEFNIRLYDKNSESDYLFFLHQNQNIFFSNIGNQNIFLEKKHNPHFKLNGRSLSEKMVHQLIIYCPKSVKESR
jgi:hypothetical protein